MGTDSQVAAAPYEEKLEDEMIEDVAVKHEDHATAILPESLWGMSEEERSALERKIVRKMDLIVLPIIMILYILNYIDRQNLAVSKLQGIMVDLDLTTQQFATCVSVLFAGYLPFQIPSNYIISRIPRPGLYICCAVVCWGAISAATAAVQSYSALVGIRVVLGAVEAVFFPGVLYYLSAWYTKKELGKRYAGLFIGQQLGNGFGGLIAAGVLKLDGKHGIRGWRWLFIVEGTATVGFGIIFAFLMPEFPHNARVLKPIERDLAVWRLEQEAGAGEAHDDISTTRAYLSALKDPKVYMLIGCMICSQAMGSVGNFFPTILQALGYDSLITLCLTAPPYIFACFIFAGISWWSDRKQILYWPIIVCLCIGIIIYIIAMTTLNVGARYFAMMWTPVANVVPQLFIYNTLSLHVARPYPKRAAGLALINAIGGTSNIWGSYVWFAPPHFYAGFGMVLAVNVVFLCIITFYRFFVRRENRRLDAGGEEARAVMRRGVTEEQMSLGWRFVGY
ncbi:nicotinamide mononucleotide permease [Cryptococcus neoformans]|uniref:Nicotinamide mononucleotide permease n=2 Tax=Cryptococcus neoformans TaxID=5207 RepID=A0A854QDN3_CRYNE|nr:nicotinamide mononucleotide permease [Cryptococcus neoformans var. grubii H99]AUB26785.1 nicotinamide mononucleotide permease [Cryptococcus neoformans var. grubii]OWZ29917.1 nicotinamide mononucleotide permease [Cryptococcus neoformans var. grubii AD2-60a]OWZ36757.1 nicotinamide mononucleotide permease [Cryptococcus neoformans var. grubii AD1-83a]OWZ41791.1 nicotinamide mononucleotide permease [Cryptococcus neoformans var. grubii C23]OWZ52794.1 nicotinamide mononucleotide permease [Cryptoco|eukprot:XP_012051016.1 nicotinamide mononucleotide permease [Cryptococcus neoformans var. grubii H99]